MANFVTANADLAKFLAEAPIETDRHGNVFADLQDMQFRLRSADEKDVVSDTWPGGRVPYFFDDDVTQQNRDRFREATRFWSLRANLVFEELPMKPVADADHVLVYNSTGNSATVGYAGGEQYLRMKNWSTQVVIIHEIAHTLGLIHEQCRSDRDDHVTVDIDNVLEDFKHNFRKLEGNVPQGPYDFASIMQYGLFDFAKEPTAGNTKKPTIRVKDPFGEFAFLCGQRRFTSYVDTAAIGDVYGRTAFADYLRIDARDWPAAKIEHRIEGLQDAAKGAIYVDLAVPGPDTVSRVVVTTTSASGGDCDLYSRRVPIRQPSDWDGRTVFGSPLRYFRRSAGKTNEEKLDMPNGPANAPAVRYPLMLHAHAAYRDVTLTIALVRR